MGRRLSPKKRQLPAVSDFPPSLEKGWVVLPDWICQFCRGPVLVNPLVQGVRGCAKCRYKCNHWRFFWHV